MPPAFTIISTIVTVAVTALLTFILWRINRPKGERVANRDGSDGAVVPIVVDGGADDHDSADGPSDGGSDGGAGDGGGAGGGN